ncbi:MAG: urocanate hydratase [Candidatus Komeilibacteria bacterium]|nr:urocanate hydratase [Candidatus Komeilibacteria bacterium]
MIEIPKLITGSKLNCRNWQIEALLRMLVNNIVQGAKPEELIIYGGRGKAARNWDCYHAIVQELLHLQPNQTLLIQSGKPVGVITTSEYAPRALIVNSMMVPLWSTDAIFYDLEARGLTMYGQMTAGSWAFIGQQGIMQGTYETFAAAGAGPGKFLFSAGLGNMGGAQAIAGKMTGAATLIVEIDETKAERCLKEGWIDTYTKDIEHAFRLIAEAKKNQQATSIALIANVVDVLQWLLTQDANKLPDIITDQTAAHDPLTGYFPTGLNFLDALALRKNQPEEYINRCKVTMAEHVTCLLKLQEKGITVFDYGNGLRFHAKDQGVQNAFDIKGFVPLYVRPLFCEGRGPFRVAALSGDPKDIEVIDEIILKLFPDNHLLVNWIAKAKKYINFAKQPGLPARVCWLGMGERARAVEEIWWAIRRGQISAPIWVGRDHLDCGSVSSPGRETEGMLDGSDAIADWPILNALVATASGATWVSVHNGGGVGIGKSIHAGQCFVITSSEKSLWQAQKVFTNDPLMGIIRHADAGYPDARQAAAKHQIRLPMLDKHWES